MELFDEGRTDEYLNLNSDKIKKRYIKCLMKKL